MTQTVYKRKNAHEVEIWADYGQNKQFYGYSVLIQKVTLQEFLEELKWTDEDIWTDDREDILEELSFFKKGYAWKTECNKSCERQFHENYRDAYISATSDYFC